MKTIQPSIIVIAIIVTIGITVLTFLTLQNNIDKQNQLEKNQARVHAPTDNGTKYVKINDMAPNSSLIFVYPYTGNETSFHIWILIRLPIHDGGNNDDISSFRAYSAVDIQLWCLIKYWPQHEWFEDPCHGSLYEPVYGIPFAGPAVNYAFKNNALPQLDLGVDKDGYIYVKPPIFEIDKNGQVGYGRKLPPDLIEKYREIGKSGLKTLQ
jgi:ubiquinol-cytochrome c reductase iron-sulfur subunit